MSTGRACQGTQSRPCGCTGQWLSQGGANGQFSLGDMHTLGKGEGWEVCEGVQWNEGASKQGHRRSAEALQRIRWEKARVLVQFCAFSTEHGSKMWSCLGVHFRLFRALTHCGGACVSNENENQSEQ